jgi:dihydropteroate synthase
MPTLPPTIWQTSRFDIDLNRPRIMGIVNVTPDSFSDGGRHADTRSALQHAERLMAAGADILDVGGESTRPGAPPVALEEELARVLPVVQALVPWGVPVSIDTYKPEVMQACLDSGADMVNDVWALQKTFATGQGTGLDVVARHPKCGVCVMHMHLDPQRMQIAPMEGDAVPQVVAFLADQAHRLEQAGVARSRVVLDCGIGFGKTVEQNFALLSRQAEVLALGYPLLAGWSRKSSLGRVTGQDEAHHRVAASVAAAVLAVDRGARVVRVHDVRETADALKVWQAMQG